MNRFMIIPIKIVRHVIKFRLEINIPNYLNKDWNKKGSVCFKFPIFDMDVDIIAR